MATIVDLLKRWREQGPAAWAESTYGWIMPDGQPILLEDWQRAGEAAWWEHRETVTTMAVSNIKKVGKTTLNAILLAWRWLAMPGEHLVCANDFDQSAGRQFSMIAKMVRRHSYLSANCKVTGKVLTFIPTESTLEAIEVSATTRSGSNHLTTSHTECWGVIYPASVTAFEELTPPPGLRYGLPALRVCDSYSGYEQTSTIWHNLVDRGLAGERVSDEWPIYRNGGLLLFHIEGEEAQERCFRGTAEEREAYYDDQRDSLRAGTFSRLHLNQRAAGEERFVDIALFDALEDADCRPLVPGDYRPVVLGADAATKRDNVALVGCTWDPARERVELCYVREWRPQMLAKLAGGVDLDGTIGDEILTLHREHVVTACYCDPYQMAAVMNRLQRAGVSVVEFPQTAQRTQADQALFDAITSATLGTFPSPQLRAAIQKAVAKETARGYRLSKRRGDDLAVALSMAHWGALQGMNQERRIPYPDGRPGAVFAGASRDDESKRAPWERPGSSWGGYGKTRGDARFEPPDASGFLSSLHSNEY